MDKPPTSSGSRKRRLAEAVAKAADYLRERQRDDGHWCAELEGDSILESEYALLLYFLKRGPSDKFSQLANSLRSTQMPDGGWPNYPGGPAIASVSVKAYLVLRLAGDDPGAAHMERAREAIRACGGLAACNSYTRVLLAIFGVCDWQSAPAIPPELILLPRWFYFNIYEMSSWSRAIVVPLSIVWAKKPVYRLPREVDPVELVDGDESAPKDPRYSGFWEIFWARFFVGVDRLIKTVERRRWLPLRRRALERAEAWVLDHLVASDGLAAIFPSIMNAALAFVCLGRSLDDPAVASQLEALERLEILEGDKLRVQPCHSPVWDTALTVNALLAEGAAPDDPDLERALEWLLTKEVRRPGDWKIKNQRAEPGGWAFEYQNDLYPDCDDTAEVVAIMSRLRPRDPNLERERRQAIDRATSWLLMMQSSSGGWGAFDRDCDKRPLEYVPFADHNAMLDPATVDVSARAIVALLKTGAETSQRAVARGLAFLEREQELDGSWYGRWGCNYLYGTWLALAALAAAGRNLNDRVVRRGVEWLLSCQHEDGGWGETLGSYDDPSLKGVGPTTASQTAWALMGLLAVGGRRETRVRAAIERGVDYLLSTQRQDGSWVDEAWTGTGFPGVFYLCYHFYPCYFPLEALAAYRAAQSDTVTTMPVPWTARRPLRSKTAASG